MNNQIPVSPVASNWPELERAEKALNADRFQESIAASLVVIAQALSTMLLDEQLQVRAVIEPYGDSAFVVENLSIEEKRARDKMFP